MSDDPIPVIVAGASGRMGRALVSAVGEDSRLRLAGATEIKGHPDLGKDAGSLAGIEPSGVALSPEMETLVSNASAVIDFTSPQATMRHLKPCADHGTAMVIGTTGLSEEQKAVIAESARKMPVVLAPNMSVGVNLLFYLVKLAAETLGDGFDIEIIEAHHRMKKDAPSGTALRLMEVAARARGWDPSESARFSRDGMIGQRPDREIGVQSIRAADIVGEHTVIMAGPGERVELTHRAASRAIFAKGAVRAVKWVVGKAPGCYDMQDVLGLEG